MDGGQNVFPEGEVVFVPRAIMRVEKFTGCARRRKAGVWLCPRKACVSFCCRLVRRRKTMAGIALSTSGTHGSALAVVVSGMWNRAACVGSPALTSVINWTVFMPATIGGRPIAGNPAGHHFRLVVSMMPEAPEPGGPRAPAKLRKPACAMWADDHGNTYTR